MSAGTPTIDPSESVDRLLANVVGSVDEVDTKVWVVAGGLLAVRVTWGLFMRWVRAESAKADRYVAKTDGGGSYQSGRYGRGVLRGD